MIDISITEKLNKIKDKFKGEHPDALKQIAVWEKTLMNLSLLDDFASHAVTQEIAARIKQKIKDTFRKRAFGTGLSSEDIHRLDDRLDELKWILKLFRPSYESDIEAITEEIENELL